MTTEATTTPTEATTTEPTRSNLALTIAAHRRSYKTTAGRNGRKTQSNDDVVARALLLVDLAVLKDLSGLWFDGRRYDHLNTGHARMCIGNLIRGALNKNDSRIAEWIEGVLASAEEAKAA